MKTNSTTVPEAIYHWDYFPLPMKYLHALLWLGSNIICRTNWEPSFCEPDVTIHFRGKPSVLPTFLPDLPHVAFAKRSAVTAGGRPTEEEDDKEKVQKGPRWCWGPVWPRRVLPYSNNQRNQVQHNRVTLPGSPVWSLSCSQKQIRKKLSLNFWGSCPQEGKMRFLASAFWLNQK